MAYNDLGKTIVEIVDQAVNSKEFKELNKTINSSLVIALDEVQRNLDKAKKYKGAKVDHTKYTLDNTNLFKNISFNKILAILCMLIGAPIAFFSALATAGVLFIGIYSLFEAFVAAICASATLMFSTLTIKGLKLLMKCSRFEKYVKALNLKPVASIKDLAYAVKKTHSFVRDEIETMILKGWFKQGHLDDYKKFLFVDDESYLTLHEDMQTVKKEEKKEEVKKDEPVLNEQQEVIQTGKHYVSELKRLNVNIEDLGVSTSIDHIEVTTTKIFEYVENHPENIKDIRKFMKYYLPMTIKLLKAYEELEQQPFSGENIENSKDEIRSTLKSLDYAFMKILDDLFVNTAMDVSSDATVLENMLRQDGLSEEKLKI